MGHPLVYAERHRAALVFFGKHPAESLKSNDMHENSTASSMLLALSHASWTRRLLLANSLAQFDVFAHSWNPEVASQFRELWAKPAPNAQLVDAVHEVTHFRAGGRSIDFECVGSMCSRTASMLLSIDKAMLLKRTHELRFGFVYDSVIAARHDLYFGSDVVLPAELWQAGRRDVWLPQSCLGTCKIDETKPVGRDVQRLLDASCVLRSGDCPIPFMTDKVLYARERRSFNDWMFFGSSESADLMADAVRSFRQASSLLNRGDLTVSAHWLWPHHILERIRATLRFGIVMYPRDVLLARDVRIHGEAAAFGSWRVADESIVANREDLGSLEHPEAFNRQCQAATDSQTDGLGISSRRAGAFWMCCNASALPNRTEVVMDLYTKPVTAYVQRAYGAPQASFGAGIRPASAPPVPPPPPHPSMESSIDARLDAVRSELAKLRAQWPSPTRQRPMNSRSSTPAKATPQPMSNSHVNPDKVLFYMSRFEPRRLRVSGSAASFGSIQRRRSKALGSEQSDFTPGQHPIGYRPLSGSTAYKSAPAYSFRQKYTHSQYPYATDDTPGPGAYHTSDY